MSEQIQIPAWVLSGIGIFLVSQTGLAIWWAATITANLKGLDKKVDSLADSGFATQTYVDKEFGKMQKEIDAAHRRIDDLQSKHS